MVQIGELALRVPGNSKEEGRRLGNEVVRRVSDGLPGDHRDGHWGALDLRVTIPPGTTQSHMASLIAEAILRGLA